jgi:crotonobetainyl-CoA:carnitine CoA-transferase CaiB-like acyl-CoA transferase
VKERGYFVEHTHPVAGRVTLPGAPFVMQETPWSLRRPAPRLGEHNAEVFCDIAGYARDDLQILSGTGVI